MADDSCAEKKMQMVKYQGQHEIQRNTRLHHKRALIHEVTISVFNKSDKKAVISA